LITQKELKKILHYDEKTGVFTWKVNRGNNQTKGEIAGYPDKDGYVRISINKKRFLAHRLAWLYKKGYLPENLIDHEDRNPYHNWWDNLRETSHSCNAKNTGNFSHNTSGVKGIWFNKSAKKWQSEIKINKVPKYLGIYKDFTEAVAHRLAAEQCINWEGCDSSSPAYQYMKEVLTMARVKKDLEDNIEALIDGLGNLKDELRNAMNNKAAAGRARKLTLSLAKRGKDFRTLSVAYSKE